MIIFLLKHLTHLIYWIYNIQHIVFNGKYCVSRENQKDATEIGQFNPIGQTVRMRKDTALCRGCLFRWF